LDKIEGNLTVRFSDGTETYLPLGTTQPVPMEPHEYCYCDDANEVLCRLEIRQVEKTKVDENVTNILYIIEGNEATDDNFSVCKGTNYSFVNLESQYCFIGKTDEENSLVCITDDVPANTTERDDGWRAFRHQDILL